MEKLIELDYDSNILVSSTIIKKEKPDYIYIPIPRNSKILVHQNEQVVIGSPIIKANKIITSSISGRITAIKKVNTYNGEYDAIEILNDYQEKNIAEVGAKRSLSKISKDYLNVMLKEFNLDLKSKDTLVLNAIDDEPYVLTSNFYLFNEQTDFLELLDKLSKAYNLKKTIITIKSTSSNNINNLMDKLGMYPNISLMILPNLYLLGNPYFLVKHLDLNLDSTEVISTEDFYKLKNFIKNNRLVSTKYLTISGNNLKNPSVVAAKIGSKLTDILADFKINANSLFIANGLMQGKRINLDNFIVTDDLNSILVMKQPPLYKEEKCLNCGACIEVCPVNLNPILFKKAKYAKNITSKCINCGLCTYICPSHINFNINKRGD